KNIFIGATICHGLSGDGYILGSNEQTGECHIACVSLKTYSPVIVEIQRKVYLAFMGCAIRYYLNPAESTK
ncbi:hypothetical protein BX666DRAFT_2064380, partial [Dichotomocladium elegans]